MRGEHGRAKDPLLRRVYSHQFATGQITSPGDNVGAFTAIHRLAFPEK